MAKTVRGEEAVTVVGKNLLLDSDFLVGFSVSNDPHHKEALDIYGRIEKSQGLLVGSLVVLETATVISGLVGAKEAVEFLDFIEYVPSIHVDEKLQEETVELFESIKNKNISMVGCSNVIIARKIGIKEILSFDKFYSKFGLKILKHRQKSV